MEELNKVVKKLEVRLNMLQLTKEYIEKTTHRNKIKDIEKEAKLLEERLDEIKHLKRKIQLLKLEKGETSEDMKIWGNWVEDRIDTFKDINDEFEATLAKLEVKQDHQARLKEDECEWYQLKRRLAEELKIEEAKLKMDSLKNLVNASGMKSKSCV